MVGTTLACALGKNTKLANKTILLLEGSKQFQWEPKEQYSNRVVALNLNTKSLLSSIGAWNHIAAVRYGSVKSMQVWDAVSDAMIQFNQDDYLDNVAYIVENDLLLHSVNRELAHVQNVNVLYQAIVDSLKLPDVNSDTSKVLLENGKSFTCDLLLGCDGANSKVRKTMGVQYLSWNYNQMAVVATLKLAENVDDDHNTVAWQRFLPDGPIALLPLRKNLSSLVWTTTPNNAKTLLSLPEEQFVDEVNSAIWKEYPKRSIVSDVMKGFDRFLEILRLPSNAVRQLPPNVSGIEEGSRAAFPLGFGHATKYFKPGVALVGDAAHRVHPLAGQGVNLGFGDVSCLNEILGDAIYCGSVIEDVDNLRKYETERQRHNIPTMLAIDGIQKLYNTNLTPVVLLRSVGLQFTNALYPLKVTKKLYFINVYWYPSNRGI
ncbi:ubiquinone biosynthesis monooxygenase COQ6, mitochondrial [Agrilus planipennis]|uniref:Ubiquinone biosynthesis monooxygenase COQ6, mitochondrial n=1 Tax=Agrilus planipennis TaxID=224129 RepID=A0A7F5RCM0_AGRPL|nr:ubiquinone biosynthesis monooxygenase COQ6, mitochondrial [Agrilus planipennis]